MPRGSLILKALLQSLRFAGRSSRQEFLIFVPVGLGLCVLAGAAAVRAGFTFLGVVLTVFVAAVPLFALWCRRLHDVGTSGRYIAIGWASLLMALTFAWAATQAGASLSAAGAQWKNPAVLLIAAPLALVGYLGDVIGPLVALLVSLPLFVVFLVQLSFTLGQSLLPSQSGPNRYGPNPNEVPQ